LLILVYAFLALAPLALAWPHEPFDGGPLIDDIASALGMVAFAALLVEFLFSGRHRWISGRIGVAGTIRIHRWVAFGIIAFIVVHPFLYAAPDGDSWPWFNAADPTLSLNAWSLFSGLAAWVLTAAMVLTAIDRHALSWSYETWRNTHVLGALVLAALIAFHALTAPGHSGQMPLLAYWLVLLGVAGLVLAELFVLRPWLQRRRPYVVQTVDKIGDRTWALYLRPESGPGGSVMRFRPGQFAWVKLGGRAFATRDHPFSMSTAPTAGSSIGFTIKEKGDFTDRIGEIAAGTRAYLDGPHGHLVPDEQPVATVYIAAGTGIGPVLSHLRTFRLDGDSRRLTLIYSVSSDRQIPERAELDRLAEVLDLTVHYVVQHPSSRWRGAMGLIDEYLLDACLPRQERAGNRYFVCGPDHMIKSVHAALRALGIPANRILTGS
jgi:predicted ferric reductase